jgi:hypothetical protein
MEFVQHWSFTLHSLYPRSRTCNLFCQGGAEEGQYKPERVLNIDEETRMGLEMSGDSNASDVAALKMALSM